MASGEGWVLVEDAGTKRLVVEYAPHLQIEWLAVTDAELRIEDLVPCYLPNEDDDPYEAYDLSRDFPSLLKGAQPAGVVAEEVRESFRRRQLELASRASVDDVVVKNNECDWVLSTKRRVQAACTIPAVDCFPHGSLAVVSWNLSDSSTESRVENLPRERFPLSCAAFHAPVFRGSVDAFVTECNEALASSWRRRRDLCDEFRRVAAVVHLDTLDFSALSYVVQIGDRAVHVVALSFAADFPAQPPTMTARDFRTGSDVAFDRALYKYSPRWEPTRLAKELIDHACACLAARSSASSSSSSSSSSRGGVPSRASAPALAREEISS